MNQDGVSLCFGKIKRKSTAKNCDCVAAPDGENSKKSVEIFFQNLKVHLQEMPEQENLGQEFLLHLDYSLSAEDPNFWQTLR